MGGNIPAGNSGMKSRVMAALFILALLNSCSKSTSLPENFPGLLSHRISVAELQGLCKSGTHMLILDARKPEEFETGRIPGASNVTRSDISNDSFAYKSLTASREQIEKVLTQSGATAETPLVLYDYQMNADAANLWWILWRFGKRNVMLLDGGFQAWKAAGGEISTEGCSILPGEFHFTAPEDLSRYASLETVVRSLSDTGTILLDVRSLEEYTGAKKAEAAKKPGRIPGSIWMNYSDLTEEGEGCVFLKSKEEIQKILNAKGIVTDKKIICYCESGVRSAHTTFVLTEIMGYKNVYNYDGSWEEWSHHDELPAETGDGVAVEEKNIN